MECPDCDKYLHDKAVECICGWKMPFGNKTSSYCDCGKRVEIDRQCYSCWSAEHHKEHMAMLDNVRANLDGVDGRKLAKMENESTHEYAERCRAWLRASGAMGRIGRARQIDNDRAKRKV